ncbi:MerR family transcriptional regulator [Nocardia sp. CDC159]|uniref:MerR family transcriptional regulator n=1 Tax=Nocardia pulmonis TaxID=2951408 RepID=A0A9X2IUG4_9NOCA|nr:MULTISPECIES: MerR family transcriptional regulator [Nocardia]MCM6772058.1 MerR family transcriptional regulator [Nocardia pulmonis]MCM6785284.1 MerR family transcriptional regulator [Nocardia sp. CDC159]
MAEYRIDDLARAAGTTTRNVRNYQERGLLPTPERRSGRALIYDDSHLARLKIIDALLQRGFTTAHIADFITSWETGKDLTEILGLQQAVTATWGSPEEPMSVPRELVDTLFGDDPDGAVGPEELDRLAELGLIRLHGDTVEFTHPELLETFGALHGYGFGLRGLIEVHAAVVERVQDIADTMVAAAKDHIVAEHGPGWLPGSDEEIAETTKMLNHLRELGVATVHKSLEQALDRTLRRELSAYLATAAERHATGEPMETGDPGRL